MRKITLGFMLAAVLSVFLLSGNVVCASEDIIDEATGFVYDTVIRRDADGNNIKDENGNYIYDARIKGCGKVYQELVIPSEIGGYRVSVIGTGAFERYPAVSVVIPDTVTEIKRDAFKGCNSITSVKLSNNLLKMGEYAFGNCLGLTEITIPKSLENAGQYEFSSVYGDKDRGAFNGSTNLTTINFESGITKLPAFMFANLKHITSVVVPDTVTEIGNYAFYGCDNLKSVKLPAGLKHVGAYAFDNCYNLAAIDIPDGVTEIGTYAFRKCVSLKSVELPKNLVKIQGGVFYDCNALQSVWIPKSLELANSIVIGVRNSSYLFDGCVNLKNVTFENGIEVIIGDLFSDCEGIEEIVLPDTVKEIKIHAFENCGALRKITIPASVEKIHAKAFEGTSDMTIYGWTGSYAQEFAAANNIPFVSVGTVQQEDPKPQGFGTDSVYRIAGSDRYATSLLAAAMLKAQLGVDQFDSVILADGRNFPDALAGSYLAGQLKAPIIMVNQMEKFADPVRNYIRQNLKVGGRIYVLGGTSAIPNSVLNGLSDYRVMRLAGSNRYDTNLLILNEIVISGNEILVCTGTGFADSLSASATGLPILLVGKSLNAQQMNFLDNHRGFKYTIIGGSSAVSSEIESTLRNYGTVDRLAGKSRYETSIMVAARYFPNAGVAVLAAANNYPDGLCGGPLAMSKNAPLILTITKNAANAIDYINSKGIKLGAVLGGSGLISDAVANYVFGSGNVVNW